MEHGKLMMTSLWMESIVQSVVKVGVEGIVKVSHTSLMQYNCIAWRCDRTDLIFFISLMMIGSRIQKLEVVKKTWTAAPESECSCAESYVQVMIYFTDSVIVIIKILSNLFIYFLDHICQLLVIIKKDEMKWVCSHWLTDLWKTNVVLKYLLCIIKTLKSA